MAVQELRVNKLRTFLSLFGITIGIFCIISILAIVDSLQRYISVKMEAIGSSIVWIDKWNYADGADTPDFPWWKYYQRPANKFTDVAFLKKNSPQTEHVCLFLRGRTNSLEYQSGSLNNVELYAITEDFDKIQDLKIIEGHYLSEAEFAQGSKVCVIGNTNAEMLFGNPERAIGKSINVHGKKLVIVGLIEKVGGDGFGFNFDHCVIVPYKFFASMFSIEEAERNFIIAQPKKGVSVAAMTDELRGNMRQLRRLGPTQEDNFTVNDMSQFFGNIIDGFLSKLNLGGWAIAGLSLIVGTFGVANIMFVTVRERTSQIGLKKALGAKRKTILTEFLLESSFICIIGGFIGLLFVWVLALIMSSGSNFPITISPNIIMLAFSICIVIGVLAGIIPASQAAKMDPVVAIRSK